MTATTPGARPKGAHEIPHHATVESLGHLKNRVVAGRNELVADEPEELGGAGSGPSPYELLLAALGACTSMTLEIYARHKQWPLEGVRIALKHEKVPASSVPGHEDRAGKLDLFEVDLELRGDLSEEQRTRLVEIAKKCPVHRTLTTSGSTVVQHRIR